MILGDPYRFAIWVEHIPQWSDSYKNGFFYFFVNGNMYPDDIKTSTLSVDSKLIDKDNKKIWQDISYPLIEDIVISKNEINEIITKLKEYTNSIF